MKITKLLLTTAYELATEEELNALSEQLTDVITKCQEITKLSPNEKYMTALKVPTVHGQQYVKHLTNKERLAVAGKELLAIEQEVDAFIADTDYCTNSVVSSAMFTTLFEAKVAENVLLGATQLEEENTKY